MSLWRKIIICLLIQKSKIKSGHSPLGRGAWGRAPHAPLHLGFFGFVCVQGLSRHKPDGEARPIYSTTLDISGICGGLLLRRAFARYLVMTKGKAVEPVPIGQIL